MLLLLLLMVVLVVVVVAFFFKFNFLSSLYILDISPLSEGLVKRFSQPVGCCFVLLTVFFALQKLSVS
jgi:hypothetical protein